MNAASAGAADRRPVIVGVAQLNDRPARDEDGRTPLALMAEAVRLAERDAGVALLGAVDWLGIVRQISEPAQDDMAALLPAELGIAPRHVERSDQASGETPVRLLDDAADAIASGEAEVAVVVGAEATRTAMRLAAARGESPALFRNARRNASALRLRYRLIEPAQIYPLYENACRAAWGQSLAEAQGETGRIWSIMSEVAAAAPGAWLRTPRTPGQIVTPAPDNRPVAFPYNKLMVSNAMVNQGAALILTSLGRARAIGIADEKLVHVGLGAAAHEAEEPLARAHWDESAGMRATLETVMAANHIGAGDLDHVELYSCFPCVPKMARRILGWPAEKPVTVHGGMTFGGGPIGNYMTHAAAAMVATLRANPGDAGGSAAGLLYANGGHCTHNHAILLSRHEQPAARPARCDAQAEADRRRGAIPPLTDDHEGAAVLETYTVLYGRDAEPIAAPVLCRDERGRRIVAHAGENLFGALTDGAAEPVGWPGVTRREGDVLIWSRLP